MFDSTVKDGKRRLGDFEILRELGRGGMGVVYEARQVSLNRKVALKVLSASLGLSSKAVIRFRREAEAAARLHHTNIVPIYATGDQEGIHFYAMELIEGPGLDQVIEQLRSRQVAASSAGPPSVAAAASAVCDAQSTLPGVGVQTSGIDTAANPAASTVSLSSSFSSGVGGYFDSVARVFADVADALDYAHAQGVIHRDIKPSNLLLSVDGRMHVNDFGLAHIMEQPGMTVSGEFVGTPMYMSPEQIAAGRAPLDHRTDVYSLGTALYEVLTLEPPFAGQRRDQVIGQIVHKEPKRPRSINRKIPRDLETVCLKAMEKDPDKRYQAAGDMAKDLRAYVNRFAISARRVGPVGRAVRWAKRHKPLAAALLCAAVAIAIAASLAIRAHVTERQHRLEAIERELDDGTRFLLYGNYERAQQAVARAIALGAKGGRLHLLRGRIAHYYWSGDDEVKELQQAVADLPQSVEARASLALIYSGAGRYDDYFSTMREAESLQPRTAGDYLAMGIVEANQDPQRGIELLDKAVELRATPLALLERAWARTQCVDDGMDPRLLELAVRDVAAAKTILATDDINCMFRAMQVWIHAGRVYRLLGMEVKRQDVLKLAAEEVVAADRLPMDPDRIRARVYYYTELHQPEPRLHWIKVQYEQFPGDAARMAYATELFWRGQTQQAIDLLAGDSLDFQTYKGLFLPDTADGAREAMRIYSRLQAKGSLVNRLYSHYIPMITGHADIARADALALRATGITFPSLRGWSNRVLDYHCGLLSDEQLLKAAGQSNWCHTEAYFNIALRRLDEGDRSAAQAMFRKCADLGVQDYEEYGLAVGLVHRMETDPQWPRWLPRSPVQEPSTVPATR